MRHAHRRRGWPKAWATASVLPHPSRLEESTRRSPQAQERGTAAGPSAMTQPGDAIGRPQLWQAPGGGRIGQRHGSSSGQRASRSIEAGLVVGRRSARRQAGDLNAGHQQSPEGTGPAPAAAPTCRGWMALASASKAISQRRPGPAAAGPRSAAVPAYRHPPGRPHLNHPRQGEGAWPAERAARAFFALPRRSTARSGAGRAQARTRRRRWPAWQAGRSAAGRHRSTCQQALGTWGSSKPRAPSGKAAGGFRT